ncbi:MAG TPA: hypothetical protein VK797_30345 [Tepidisphaeraceae bacterium]|jgi:hypothetical protein|nr:hypothetical protein [Tepidisphaeraceae bacterium]
MTALPRPLSLPSLPVSRMRLAGERRRFRRHDLEQQGITVERWDSARQTSEPLGKLIDISAAGVRLRTKASVLRTDNQVRVRLSLPAFAGICPFIDTTSDEPRPKREWTGWMSVNRVQKTTTGEYDVAGTLVDMEDMDRGMLGLYLSTQPLAA